MTMLGSQSAATLDRIGAALYPTERGEGCRLGCYENKGASLDKDDETRPGKNL